MNQVWSNRWCCLGGLVDGLLNFFFRTLDGLSCQVKACTSQAKLQSLIAVLFLFSLAGDGRWVTSHGYANLIYLPRDEVWIFALCWWVVKVLIVLCPPTSGLDTYTSMRRDRVRLHHWKEVCWLCENRHFVVDLQEMFCGGYARNYSCLQRINMNSM